MILAAFSKINRQELSIERVQTPYNQENLSRRKEFKLPIFSPLWILLLLLVKIHSGCEVAIETLHLLFC